jgi:protein-tyrosine phosphatase
MITSWVGYNLGVLFIADESNVVVIHCNAGKGRTGTAICCYLMYSSFCDNAGQALEFYKKARYKIYIKVVSI